MLGTDVVVRREPVGVVAAIPPWNVPQFTIMSKLVPALLSGCTIVVAGTETPLDPYLMAEILPEAGVPDGVVNIVTAGREVGGAPGRPPRVDKGRVHRIDRGPAARSPRCAASSSSGSRSSSAASPRRSCSTTPTWPRPWRAWFASPMNSGQACVAQTRHPGLACAYAEVVEKLAETVSAMAVGDPLDPATESRPDGRPAAAGGWRSTSRSARRVPASSSAAWPGRPHLGLVTSVRRPSSPTSTTGCGSRRRRSSVRPVGHPLRRRRRRVRIANDSEYGLPGRSGPVTSRRASTSRAGSRTGTYGVNTYTMGFAAPLQGASKSSGIRPRVRPRGLAHYHGLKSIYKPLTRPAREARTTRRAASACRAGFPRCPETRCRKAHRND